jgi:hypothetical protein
MAVEEPFQWVSTRRLPPIKLPDVAFWPMLLKSRRHAADAQQSNHGRWLLDSILRIRRSS